MFDLIDECGKDLKSFGYKIIPLRKFGISLATLSVGSEIEKEKTGLEKGDYYIFNCPFVYQFGEENFGYISSKIAEKIKLIFEKFNVKRTSRILIIGLGNPDIASDRLGKEVFDRINIDPLDKNNNIFKFCPNIFFSTGIDTFSIIKMFVKELKIDFLIIIDSLTTSNISRLGSSFQITTNGMTPGSGVNRFGSRICKESIGVECVSIGVPFMIYSSSLNKNDEIEMILAPKDIKENVSDAGRIISEALNEVLL